MNYKKKKIKKASILIIISLFILTVFCQKYKMFIDIKHYFSQFGFKIQELFLIDNFELNDDIILGINKELEQENNTFRKMLNLSILEYELITAEVIDRDIDWFKTITINKGSKDGIKINMAVLDTNGLIGKVVEVYSDYSLIELISSNSNSMKISVNILGDKEYFGVLDYYNKENGYVVINDIKKNSEIKIGDSVYTNGLGGIYPSGIFIGKIKNIYFDNLGLNKKVDVEFNSNLDNIRYVNIIRR